MSGLVALVGGAEHTAGCEPVDRLLLGQCGLRRAEVAVLLAASPHHRRTFKCAEAERWWAQLGARARCAFAGEADPQGRAAALLADADLIVLTGGRPWLLRQRLQHTAVGALLHERWQAGVPVAGSSAGAMVLAGHAWSLRPPAPLAPLPGLGMVPVLVVPHAGRRTIDASAARTQAAHPALEVVGIPDRTALVVETDGRRRVAGPGPLVAYPRSRSGGHVQDRDAAQVQPQPTRGGAHPQHDRAAEKAAQHRAGAVQVGAVLGEQGERTRRRMAERDQAVRDHLDGARRAALEDLRSRGRREHTHSQHLGGDPAAQLRPAGRRGGGVIARAAPAFASMASDSRVAGRRAAEPGSGLRASEPPRRCPCQDRNRSEVGRG